MTLAIIVFQRDANVSYVSNSIVSCNDDWKKYQTSVEFD